MNSEKFNKILDLVSPISKSFEMVDKKIYLVGGIVRDLHRDTIDISKFDLDFTTDATPEEIRTIIKPIAESIWLSGQRFGTIGAVINGKTIEITTHRSESYVTESRKPVVTFSTDIYEDLSRRDFTINSMAINLSTQEIIDPFHGLEDLEMKVLRTPLDPDISFSEDPLRMLRAARFVSRYNLKPEKNLIKSVRRLKERIAIVSAERIRDELNKLLETPDPNSGFRFLLKTGIYKAFFPELIDINSRHRIRYLNHDFCVRLAGLLLTTPTSARKERMKELKYSNNEILRVNNLVDSVQMILEGPINNPQYRRWHLFAADNRKDSIEIASIQRGARRKIKSIQEKSRLLDHELNDRVTPLSGSEIIDTFSIEEGPEVGEALDYLEEMFIQNGPIARDEAIKALEIWLPQLKSK